MEMNNKVSFGNCAILSKDRSLRGTYRLLNLISLGLLLTKDPGLEK